MLERYDYEKEMAKDVREALQDWLSDNDIKDYANQDRLYDDIYDDMLIDSRVTGAENGRYTTRQNAEEMLCHNWDLLEEALEYSGCGEEFIGQGAVFCDMVVRTYLLGGVLLEVMAEMIEEWE